MAVVQYSAVVTQLRGKLGGSVFNKSKNAYTLQKKQQQPKGARGYQAEVRNFFSKFQRSWKALTNAQRVNWQTCANNNPTRDRFGNQTILSGYNQFVKASMLAEYAGAPALTNPFTGTAPANLLTGVSIADQEFTQSTVGNVTFKCFLEYGAQAYGSPFYLIVDISLPVSAGVMSYHGRWSNVDGAVTAEPSQIDISTNLGDRYPLPVAGNKVFMRVRMVHVTSGTIVQEVIRDVEF